MTFRRALLLSVVVLFVTVLALWPARRSIPHAARHSPVSLPEMSTSVLAKALQVMLEANQDGSFSTKHSEIAHDPNSRWTNPAKPVDVVFPRRFSEPVAIKSGGAVVQCVPLNANTNSYSELMEGKTLIYRDAFPGCDVKYKSSIYKTEEFIVVKDRSALDENGMVSWTWEIQSEYQGTQLMPRLTPMHTIELLDEQGIPRLRIDTPFGGDCAGTAVVANKHLNFSLEGSRLTLVLNASELQLPIEIDPSWSSTGTMSVGREGARSVILNDGRILVVGGANGTSSFSVTGSSEIYSPVTETWTATGSLLVARWQHTLTLLQNGKVLVAGGETQQGPSVSISECELYDPMSGLWTTTGSLNGTRSSHEAILLNDGNVIAIAGYSLGQLQTCELYNPSTGQWTFTGAIGRA